MSFRLSVRSRARLQGVHPALIAVVEAAIVRSSERSLGASGSIVRTASSGTPDDRRRGWACSTSASYFSAFLSMPFSSRTGRRMSSSAG